MALTQLEPYMIDTTATFQFANTTSGNITTTNNLGATLLTGTLTTGAQPNITSVGTLSNLTVSGVTSYGLSADIVTTKTGATGTVIHDLTTGAIFYHTSPAANFTANFTNVPVTEGRVLMVTLMIVQGGTPYIPNAIQIDSVGQTIKWLGSATPGGTASKTDMFSFSLLRTNYAWTVYGQSAYYS